jgi:hypothetical protein
MGKHGAVVGRKQVPIRAVALGVLLLAGVVTGSWWWSLRTQSDPIDQNPVAAAAFVVSSPSCADHGTGTVVDLFPASGGQARAVIDGCGYSDGQQLAVEYLAGDPTQVRLAGTRSASGTDDVQQWWPIVLGILVVLAAGIVVVLVVDGGRFRRTLGLPARSRGGTSAGPRAGPARHALAETAEDGRADVRRDGAAQNIQDPVGHVTAMVSTTADRVGPSLTAMDGVVDAHRGGRHALLELGDEQPDDEQPDDDGWLLEPAQSWAAEMSVGGDGQLPPEGDATLPFRLDLGFPSTAELAASLQDELFTHRHAQVSGG